MVGYQTTENPDFALAGSVVVAALAVSLAAASLLVSRRLVRALSKDFPSKHAKALQRSGAAISLTFFLRGLLLIMVFAMPELIADNQFMVQALEYVLDLASLGLVLQLFMQLVGRVGVNVVCSSPLPLTTTSTTITISTIHHQHSTQSKKNTVVRGSSTGSEGRRKSKAGQRGGRMTSNKEGVSVSDVLLKNGDRRSRSTRVEVSTPLSSAGPAGSGPPLI